MLEWVSRRPIAVAIIDGRPVTFCYAAFTTERFWDVSVETLEQYRRRGLAAACFLSLAAHMGDSGRNPAWGAMMDNPASLGLASKLGFVPDSTLDGWSED
jgi:GNAT superfamily N-acetyltransferase